MEGGGRVRSVQSIVGADEVFRDFFQLHHGVLFIVLEGGKLRMKDYYILRSGALSGGAHSVTLNSLGFQSYSCHVLHERYVHGHGL